MWYQNGGGGTMDRIEELVKKHAKYTYTIVPDVLHKLFSCDCQKVDVVAHLLRFSNCSEIKKADGWLYRSYRAWETMVGIKRGSVERIISELQDEGLCEVEIRRKTTYYRLNIAELENRFRRLMSENPDLLQKGTRKEAHRKESQKQKAEELTEEEWLASIRELPAYKEIAIDAELSKCEQWCKKNGKTFSRTRCTNWLDNAKDKRPIQTSFTPKRAEEIYDTGALEWMRANRERVEKELAEERAKEGGDDGQIPSSDPSRLRTACENAHSN
jgi:hypothetical protein